MKALRSNDRLPQGQRKIVYPESDGKPMAETDVHRIQMNYLIDALGVRFESAPQVYVSGNMLLYWEAGAPRKCVSPDVFVVKGVEKGLRRVFKTWEEKNRAPCVVIEVSSESTKGEDLGRKFRLYRDTLRVKEYYIYDPLLEYLPGRMKAWELKGGAYVQRFVLEGRVASRELGLDLVDKDGVLRLVDPKTRWELRGLKEAEAALKQEEGARAEAEAARAEAEERARKLEEELDRLRRKGR